MQLCTYIQINQAVPMQPPSRKEKIPLHIVHKWIKTWGVPTAVCYNETVQCTVNISNGAPVCTLNISSYVH